jgi:hypothetical protein
MASSAGIGDLERNALPECINGLHKPEMSRTSVQIARADQ